MCEVLCAGCVCTTLESCEIFLTPTLLGLVVSVKKGDAYESVSVEWDADGRALIAAACACFPHGRQATWT